MTGKRWLAAVCVVAAAGVGPAADSAGLPTVSVPPAQSTPLGQPTRLPGPDVPPLSIPPEGGGLPNGTAVSRPLQSVQSVETPAAPAEPAKPAVIGPTEADMMKAEVAKPLGQMWQTLEYLVWWPKAQPLPPLVTAGRGQEPPILGGPNTRLLVGGGPIDTPDIAGARFTVGFAVNEAETAGLGITYFFLGSRTSTATVSDLGTARTRFIGRPIVNGVTQQSDVIPVAIPGQFGGGVRVAATDRLTGWEINGVSNLYAGPQVRLNAVAGYRYFMVNEGLRIEQTTVFPPAPGSAIAVASLGADQFDGHTRFHGGQLGLVADFTHGPVFVEATGKVALGESVMVVNISGQTVAVAPGFPFPGVTYFPGGVLAQPTNAGRFVRSAFAVLPEAAVKIGYRFRDRSRFYVGYNFIYLSEAVRPGDQVDPAVDPGQVPVFGRPAGAVAERPAPMLAKSDFWVQGLLFGLEYRY